MPFGMVWEGMGMMGWRRRRDSNPRYALSAYNGLANRRLQPLGHVSGRKLLIIHWPLGQCRNPATCARSENSATRRDTKRDTACSRWVPGPQVVDCPLGGPAKSGDILPRFVRHEPDRSAGDCREADRGIIAQRGDGFQCHVSSTLDCPLVVLFE
jgi:hypothetical protein